jgi:hypothetical protein
MEDQQLVERSRAGDVAAFEELVKRHQARAYAIAYRLLGRREDPRKLLPAPTFGSPSFVVRLSFGRGSTGSW